MVQFDGFPCKCLVSPSSFIAETILTYLLYFWLFFFLLKGIENHFSILALRIPWAVWKAKRYDTKIWTPKLSRCSICYRTNNFRKNELMAPTQKQCPVLDVTGDGSKVWCDKEQYCIGTWNVMSMNQGKLKVVKQEMARVDIDILAIGELKWTRMGEFNSNDHYIYYYRQQSLRRNWVPIIVSQRVWNGVLGCSLKNNRVI